MKRLVIALIVFTAFLFCSNTTVSAQSADSIQLIECKWDGSKSVHGFDDLPGTYHYRIYLPYDYKTNVSQYYPCMFIASPDGEATMGEMEERLKQDRWIVIMLMESRNGCADGAGESNFLSAHDDAVQKFRILKNFKCATGFSGGARYASMYPPMREGFRAVVLQAAAFGLSYGVSRDRMLRKYPKPFLIYASFGSEDFNKYETDPIRRDTPAWVKCHLQIFAGEHSWMPKELFNQAMDWIERSVFLKQPDKLSPLEYQWYYDNLIRRLQGAGSQFERYELLEALYKIGTHVPKVSPEHNKLMNEGQTIYNSRVLEKEVSSRKEYRLAEKEEEKFTDMLRKKHSVWQDRNMDSTEEKYLDTLIKLYEKVSQTYPDTVYAQKAKVRNNSLEEEFF